MAKYPAPGRVKTRLAAAVGAERAAALYRAFVLDLAERLAALELPVLWAYLPADAPFPSLLPGAQCVAQEGADLGERMHVVIARELAAGADGVIVIGADVPHVASDAIREAAAQLAGVADVVLGPATDGGYYLIGVRAPHPDLFRDVAWGTDTVLATTLARVRTLGLRTHLLAQTFDVDDADDLHALRGLLDGGAVDLPRTATLLTKIDTGRLDSSSRPGGHSPRRERR